MPRHVIANAYGTPDVLSIVDEPTPPPGDGHVVVAVRAAGVNPADVKTYSGAFGTDPARLPLRLGFEAAGVVTAVGAGVDLAPGDEVIAFRVSGAYADEIVAPASALVGKPAGMGWTEAAGLMLTGATAVHALTATSVREGDTVLIHAAAGGVGLMAVQLAVAIGARVIGTASQSNHARLMELGAEPVTYGDGLTERVRAMATGGVDAALDLVGSDEAIDVSLELVSNRDRIASIAAFARGGDAGIKVLGNGPGADPGTAVRDAARQRLVGMVEEGCLRVFVSDRYPLAAVADAHRQILTGRTSGKIVLEP